MKRIVLLLLCLLMLAGCEVKDSEPALSGADPDESQAQSEEKLPPTVESIAGSIDGLLSNAALLSPMEDDYLVYMMGLDLTRISEWTVRVQTSGTEVDQYGIFLADGPEYAKTLSDALQKYLDTTRESWADFNYLPEEMPKLEAAKVVTDGSYVFYVVASDKEQEACIKAFENAVG